MSLPSFGIYFFWMAGIVSCGPSASRTPLVNSEPEGTDVYYYGYAEGGKELPSRDVQAATDGEKRPSKASDKTIAKRESPRANEQAAKGKSKGKSNKDAKTRQAADEQAQRALADLPGEYVGTDTVTIRIDGVPERVEEDPNAKLIVDAAGDGFTFRIVDSQNGGDLCSVGGKAVGQQIEFEAGQECLQEILGLPMKATLTSGSATLNDGTLLVEYEIELELDTPAGATDGEIDYRFKGEKQ